MRSLLACLVLIFCRLDQSSSRQTLDEVKVMAISGRILTDPPVSCTLNVNGEVIRNYTMEFDHLIFGLIMYDCAGSMGQVLSLKGCVTCSFYCPENDHIEGCSHHGSTMVLGIMIGSSTTVVLMYALVLIYRKLRLVIANRRYHKRESRKQKIRKEVIYLAGKDAVREANNFDDAGYMIPRRSRSPSLKEIAIAGLAMSGGLTSYACDKTLYMNSRGQMCDGQQCVDVNTYSFSLAVGSTICFNTAEQKLVKFYFERTEMIYRYDLMYLTSDFTVMSEGYSQCKQAGECYANKCSEGAKSDAFSSRSQVEGYTCLHEGLGCEFTCWHKYACTWIHWWLVPVGGIAKVYKKDFSIWSTTMVLEMDNKKTKVEINANNPTTMFRSASSGLEIDLPIAIDSVTHDDQFIDNYLIQDYNISVPVDASSLNFPQIGRLGDYQIDIHSVTEKYAVDAIKCSVSGCASGCRAPEPALQTFRRTRHHNTLTTFSSDYNTIKARRPLFLTAKVSVGNFHFNSLYVERASCDLDIVTTYGCTGCNQLPYVVLRANSIKTPGVLPFESNCTFKQTYVSCNDDMYQLEMMDTSSCCYIYVRSINQTKQFCIDYDFTGNLTIPSFRYSKSTDLSYVVSSLINNPSFLQGIYSSILTMTGLTIGVSLISKLISRLIILRGLKVTSDKS